MMPDPITSISPTRSAAELAADLSVHQVELEMQKQELAEAHISLEASRRRYFCLFDLAPVPYFLFTREGIIAEMNLAAGEMLGGTRADAWKRPFALHLAEESRPLFHDHLRRVFNGIVDASTELRLVPGKDVIKHLLAHSSLLPSEGNQPAQVLTAFFDMTAIRESEQREKALQAQLNQS